MKPRLIKRILIVSTAHGYGGAERSMELFAPELAKTVSVVVLTGNERHRRNLLAGAKRTGVGRRLRIWSLPFDEGRRGTAMSVIRYALARMWLRPDMILTNTERSAWVVAWAARILPGQGRATWMYVRDFMWKDLPGILRLLPHAGILVPGPALLEKKGYLDPWVEPRTSRRVRVAPCMVVRQNSDGATPLSGVYALHLAAVNPWKGHAHLIRAAELLKQDGRGVRVRSRGVTDHADLRRLLGRQIAAAGLMDDAGFEMLEHVEDPTEELRGCFCVVVASVSHSGGPETFGRTVIEAWSHGKPVVAFAAGGVRHLIEHEHDGLLVEEGDERGLAEALWRLRSNPEFAACLGARGREKVLRDYELEVAVGRLWEVLTESNAKRANAG